MGEKVAVPVDVIQDIMTNIHNKIAAGTATENECKFGIDTANQIIKQDLPLPAVDVPREKLEEILKNQLGERDFRKMNFDWKNGIGDDFNIALDLLYGALNIPNLNPGVGLGKIKDTIRAIEKLAPADYWTKGNLKPLDA